MSGELHQTRETLEKALSEIRGLKHHPASSEDAAGEYCNARDDAASIIQKLIDDLHGTDWTASDVRCPKCGASDTLLQLHTNLDGGMDDDHQYRCSTCNHEWWVEGQDAKSMSRARSTEEA